MGNSSNNIIGKTIGIGWIDTEVKGWRYGVLEKFLMTFVHFNF